MHQIFWEIRWVKMENDGHPPSTQWYPMLHTSIPHYTTWVKGSTTESSASIPWFLFNSHLHRSLETCQCYQITWAILIPWPWRLLFGFWKAWLERVIREKFWCSVACRWHLVGWSWDIVLTKPSGLLGCCNRDSWVKIVRKKHEKSLATTLVLSPMDTVMIEIWCNGDLPKHDLTKDVISQHFSCCHRQIVQGHGPLHHMFFFVLFFWPSWPTPYHCYICYLDEVLRPTFGTITTRNA